MAEEHNNDEGRYVHLESGMPIFTPALEDPDPQKRADRITEKSYKDEQLTLQRKILLTQILLVVFGLFGIGIGVWQANTAQESADTSEKTILLAQKTERHTRIQSAIALKAAIDQFHLDQRPWVSVIDRIPSPHGGYELKLQNTGKTPAIDVSIECCQAQTRKAYEPAPIFKSELAAAERVRKEGIPAENAIIEDLRKRSKNSPQDMRAYRERVKLRDDWIKTHPIRQMKAVIPPSATPGYATPDFNFVGGSSDEERAYVIGQISYRDIYTKDIHHTSICFIQIKLGEFGICADGQKMK